MQSTTLEKVPGLIRGYLGRTCRAFGLDESTAGLNLFANPKYIAGFLAYLIARGVRIGQISKYCSLMRKVNDHLPSGTAQGSAQRLHAVIIEQWLAKLESQLSAAIPAEPKAEAPDILDTWEWVEALVGDILGQVDREVKVYGKIGYGMAWRVQEALIAALVTGAYCPPFRIHVLLTVVSTYWAM